ncbi:carboxypeptidase-like regulatory domain-containing protein [Lacinutrix sp. C3R15]|uniref:carboxypeptidase-like regulatory domain-containing protein n=1 Tax=Flavobacteriaceae TaxID=49546 RepID=UPI001C08F43D|nr:MULTISPECIES: carboxypeptidase-like regulatory domain-containing protein [Flavobacteriaceae]MBU2939295.1 carboxypeptidase-like regulatory domain-containing protein [Lacinutrix sp. C3R15]MDO6622610.1 carboxypeptidase-like regulatory domain-containing protein [Oceanihabitans sp. 1_MG-2023]
MKHILLIFTFLFSISYTALGQAIDRIEINGKVIVEINEVEGLVVYNKTANMRTLTDSSGAFKINVAVNDEIEISALQFKTFMVTITPDIISSRQLTAFLVERINNLDEVVILPFGLSGNLATDLNKLKTFNLDLNAMYSDVENIEEFQYTEPQYAAVENMILIKDRFYNGVDFVKITNWLIKPRFKSKNKAEVQEQKFSNFNTLMTAYTQDFISTNFEIPKEKVEAFIVYAEKNNTDASLLDTGKDIELIEYLVTQSQLFLNEDSNKN